MKKTHVNSWSLMSCNRIVAERQEKDKHSKHLKQLSTTKAQIDNTSPQLYPHLQAKLKTKKLQEDRVAEIQLENRILLQKMLNIDTKPSELSCETMNKMRVPPKSLNSEKNAREVTRISKANEGLLRRLQNANAVVDPKAQLADETKRLQLRARMSENANRFRKKDLLECPTRPSERVTPRQRDISLIEEFNAAYQNHLDII